MSSAQGRFLFMYKIIDKVVVRTWQTFQTLLANIVVVLCPT